MTQKDKGLSTAYYIQYQPKPVSDKESSSTAFVSCLPCIFRIPLFLGLTQSRLINILGKTFCLILHIPHYTAHIHTSIHTCTAIWYQTAIITLLQSLLYTLSFQFHLYSQSQSRTSPAQDNRPPPTHPLSPKYSMPHSHIHHPLSILCTDTSKNTSNGKTEPQVNLLGGPHVRDKMTKQTLRSNQRRGYRTRRVHIGRLRQRWTQKKR